MVLDTARPEGAMTGERFIKSLQDGREVFLDGKQIDDVTAHPAFAPMINQLARVYDLQYTDEYRDQMTYVSQDTGNPVSLSWLIPESLEQTRQKRRNSEVWNEQTGGRWAVARTSSRPTSSCSTTEETCSRRSRTPTATSRRTSSTTPGCAARTTSS